MAAVEIDWVLFDLNGTLLDPTAIARTWSDDPAQGEIASAALDAAVAQAMADTIVGEFRPFPRYLRAALAHRIPEDALDAAVDAAATLPPLPGAREALEELTGTTHVGVLTNSAADSAAQALEAGGLQGAVELLVGAHEVERYKPHPDVYAHAVERCSTPADRVLLAAAHWWDVHGAKRAGLRTCWIAHKEERLLETAAEPDLTVSALREVPAALARRRSISTG